MINDQSATKAPPCRLPCLHPLVLHHPPSSSSSFLVVPLHLIGCRMIQSKSALVPQLHPSRPGPTSPLLADLHMLSHAFAGRSLEKVSRGAALLPPMAIKRTIFGEPVFCQPQPTQGWDLGLRLFSQLLVKDLPNLPTSSSAYQCPSPHPPRQTLFLPIAGRQTHREAEQRHTFEPPHLHIT